MRSARDPEPGSATTSATIPVRADGVRRRLAVMQPYFFPYAGYFRLFSQVDEFVIFDCVQFPRRGRVHRCEYSTANGTTEWLTLPLARQSRDVLIRDLAFAPDARVEFDRRLASLPWLNSGKGPAADRVRDFLHAPLPSVIDYLESGLRLVIELLGISTVISRSSALDVDPSLRGQERVLAVLAARGATHYLNSPGGRDLYDSSVFAKAGMQLDFLPTYQGEFFQLLPALMSVDPRRIRDDIAPASPS
jgi:hypothetical protein